MATAEASCRAVMGRQQATVEGVRRAYDEFLRQFPDYASTESLDALRASDYGRLDEGGHVYLDYTGACLYGASQVERHARLLSGSVLGNPHSASPTSSAATSLVEEARRQVLEFFNASADYTAIFTLNASGALKHVGECYRFEPGSRLLLTADNHNSVNGIREFAQARGAVVDYVPLRVPELRIDAAALDALLANSDPRHPNLFAYPAQSNFSGVQHPLGLIRQAHAQGWDVLLDAAAFVPSNRLDLGALEPDFVSVSFYKMFGYPTGVGCLLVRNAALDRLHRPWFAGGTVNFATVHGRAHLLSRGEAGFEDGTLNFVAIPAVEIGLRLLEAAGIDRVHTRVRCLTAWLLDRLLRLRHTNGRPMARIYGPITTEQRGGIVTMNFYDPDGHLLDYRRVEELAGERGISLRTGCFCNPGAGESAEGITDEDVREALATTADLNLPRFVQFITHRGGRSAGAIRVSFGLASNFADAYRFLEFAASLRDQTRLALGEVSFDIESCRVIRDGS
ncbi:MAG TPA: aminotransferase class V-fold PLP-dependent enzyme [Vicinamibacterales bacterium]|nr:aminotransferase class V-fold PLP-dependent enzyme [Vicinamibacterales bacterium]